MMSQIGKYVFIAGLLLAAAGLIIWLFGNRFGWFGNLPGDIKYERGNFRLYVPWVSMLLISLLLTALIWAWNYLRGKF